MASKIPRRSNVSSSTKIPKSHFVTKTSPPPPLTHHIAKTSKFGFQYDVTKEATFQSNSSEVIDLHKSGVSDTNNVHAADPTGLGEGVKTDDHVSSPSRTCDARVPAKPTSSATSTSSSQSRLPVANVHSSSRLPVAAGKHSDLKGSPSKISSPKAKASSGGATSFGFESKIPVTGSRSSTTPEKRLTQSRSNPESATESKIPRSSSAPSRDVAVPTGGQRFETFLMTGDMMIRTSQSHNTSDSVMKPSNGEHQPVNISPEKIFVSDLENEVRDESCDAVFIDDTCEQENHTETEPVSTLMEQSSDTEISSPTVDIDEVTVECDPSDKAITSSDDNLGKNSEESDQLCADDTSSVDSHTADVNLCCETSDTSQEVRNMQISRSDEKLSGIGQNAVGGHEALRTCKSQEGYLQTDNFSLQLVDIDLAENHSASYDALVYDSELSSPDVPNVHDPTAKGSLSHTAENTSSPLEKSDSANRYSQQMFFHGFIRLDSERETTPESSVNSELGYEETVETVLERELEEKVVAEMCDIEEGSVAECEDGPVHSLSSPESEDSDQESLYFHPPKEVDKPSAQRLAKRLYHLEGFEKSDVSKQLSKNNDFAQFVAEEYLSFFDFTNLTLDIALREFLSKFSLSGETQERERVLAYFSHRYVQCNPSSFKSDDACHTLTCAIMLLNTDLHGQNIGRKMTSSEFVENLAELNDGDNFPVDILKDIYSNIKTEPIEWAVNEVQESAAEGDPARRELIITSNPFLEIPDASKTTEYKKGYVLRKCVLDVDGRRTALGKRGWKTFYMCLRDMVLFLYKDEQSYKKSYYHGIHNSLRVHHCLATKASDYKKKQNVFRLKTADWAEYLFQTSDPKDLEEWTDCINFIAASMSAPPLAAAVGSQQKFQRTLMPSSYTKLNLREQLLEHDRHIYDLEQDLLDHQKYPPEKGAKARIITDYTERENYLLFELKRFRAYSKMIHEKMAAFPELEPTLVETVIGEVDEPPSSPEPSPECPSLSVPLRQLPASSKAVQRSHSDSCDPHGNNINKETIVTSL